MVSIALPIINLYNTTNWTPFYDLNVILTDYIKYIHQLSWKNNGVPICTSNDDQDWPAICSDGNGGAIITWQDNRYGNYDIYAQRINSSGDIIWVTNGVVICTKSDDQENVALCSDGAGGAIITWEDRTNWDIYAQRIYANGTIAWITNGVPICTETGSQDWPQICSDGEGGAIITWWDIRGFNNDIYAQRIYSNGTIAWTPNGVPICTEDNIQYSCQICSDGVGGAIITWVDERIDSWGDIYAQLINSSGMVQWTNNGTRICDESNGQENPQICSDESGGAIITWSDYRDGDGFDIYAQRIYANGTEVWTTNGVAICNTSGWQEYPQICSNENGGAIITWEDYRNDFLGDIYAQQVDSSGNLNWTSNGVAICTKGSQYYPEICGDGAGGAIIAWENRKNIYSDYNIYAQRICLNGTVAWSNNGVAICAAGGNQYFTQICTNGSGGAIITWLDYRNGNYDIYAQSSDYPAVGSSKEIPFLMYFALQNFGTSINHLYIILGSVAVIGILLTLIVKFLIKPKKTVYPVSWDAEFD